MPDNPNPADTHPNNINLYRFNHEYTHSVDCYSIDCGSIDCGSIGQL